MKKKMTNISLFLFMLIISGCSVFGNSNIEIAPYTVLKKDGQFELRHYEELVLASTPMQGMGDKRGSFGKLFNYISGENQNDKKISMTAPVFLDQTDKETEMMSFVLPKDYSIETAPTPNNQTVKLKRITDYTVATVTFNGILKQANIEKYKQQLQDWIKVNKLETIGAPKAAGYNPPFTLPPFRRNEVLIPVKKP